MTRAGEVAERCLVCVCVGGLRGGGAGCLVCVFVSCRTGRNREGGGVCVCVCGRWLQRAPSPDWRVQASEPPYRADRNTDLSLRVGPQSRALPRIASTAVPRATLCRTLSTKVEPDPWVLEEYEATDVTPPELFGYCALHPPPHPTACGSLRQWPAPLCLRTRAGACARAVR